MRYYLLVLPTTSRFEFVLHRCLTRTEWAALPRISRRSIYRGWWHHLLRYEPWLKCGVAKWWRRTRPHWPPSSYLWTLARRRTAPGSRPPECPACAGSWDRYGNLGDRFCRVSWSCDLRVIPNTECSSRHPSAQVVGTDLSPIQPSW